MPVILTVTLNPSLDKSVRVASFCPGETNRVTYVRRDIGGKGINVAVVLRELGEETMAFYLAPVGSEGEIGPFLLSHGIEGVCSPVPGALRENLKIYDGYTGEMTEVNEPGPEVTKEALESLRHLAAAALSPGDILVLSGSVPPGTPDDEYARWILMAKEKGVRAVLDASGVQLANGLCAGPALVKPNRAELAALCGRTLDTRDAVRREAEALLNAGAGAVCVSLGEEGAMYVTQQGSWYSSGSEVRPLGLQGAGDSMVAGLCAALRRGLSPQEALLNGVAAAQGSLCREGTLLCTRELFLKMRSAITAEKL